MGGAAPAGFFRGDYMGLASAGDDFVLFSQPHHGDPASVFARRVGRHSKPDREESFP